MSTHSTNPAPRMRKRDEEMVPRVLVLAMFALMAISVALVAFAQITDRPNVGVVPHSPIETQIEVTMTGDRTGNYTVTNIDGTVIADSHRPMSGFIAVIGRTIEHKRNVVGIAGNPPVIVARRENGKIAIIDPATEAVVDLIGYGADNVAAFAKLLEPKGN